MKVKQLTPIVSIATPLAFITLAAVLSGWFNLLDNALSDLGHATKSNVAIIFNLGLLIGGFLLYTNSLIASRVERGFRILMGSAGFSLALVGVFDEVYGLAHFIVSIIFSIILLSFLVYYSSRTDGWRRNASLIGIIASITGWALHFTVRAPRGAAIPELISIFAVTPFYLDVYMEGFKKE